MDASIEVIGAGFGRTGTASLSVALDMLGYKTHHMKADPQDRPSFAEVTQLLEGAVEEEAEARQRVAAGTVVLSVEGGWGASGGDLFSMRGQLPEHEVRSLTWQLLSALRYLHGLNVWHRDIKTGNLLLTLQEGRRVLKVADFGSARSAVDASLATGGPRRPGEEEPPEDEGGPDGAPPDGRPSDMIQGDDDDSYDRAAAAPGGLGADTGPGADGRGVCRGRGAAGNGLVAVPAAEGGFMPPLTSLVCTPCYRAPEVVMSRGGYSSAMDMWSAGSVFGGLLHRGAYVGKAPTPQLQAEFTYPAGWLGDQTLAYRAAQRAEAQRGGPPGADDFFDFPPASSSQSSASSPSAPPSYGRASAGAAARRRRAAEVAEPIVAFGPPGTTGRKSGSGGVRLASVPKPSKPVARGKVYEAHIAEVRRTVPPDQLLEYRVQDGWAPLCAFLGKPVPEGKPFPHVNDTAEFQQHIQRFRAKRRNLRIAFAAANAVLAAAAAAAVRALLLWAQARPPLAAVAADGAGERPRPPPAPGASLASNPPIFCRQKGHEGSSRPLTQSWKAHCTHSPCWQPATSTATGRSMQMEHTLRSSSDHSDPLSLAAGESSCPSSPPSPPPPSLPASPPPLPAPRLPAAAEVGCAPRAPAPPPERAGAAAVGAGARGAAAETGPPPLRGSTPEDTSGMISFSSMPPPLPPLPIAPAPSTRAAPWPPLCASTSPAASPAAPPKPPASRAAAAALPATGVETPESLREAASAGSPPPAPLVTTSCTASPRRELSARSMLVVVVAGSPAAVVELVAASPVSAAAAAAAAAPAAASPPRSACAECAAASAAARISFAIMMLPVSAAMCSALEPTAQRMGLFSTFEAEIIDSMDNDRSRARPEAASSAPAVKSTTATAR
ncbi:Serine/threonine-protein kinase DCLK1 [Tetrabaena socialis]|uniref:Serine/threonine-protein kinase DCLK1 n=1 Tax=Tetrabaena socialis TaxID=47790 RepID=A0A2J8A570_9CHLO|nr:Serine/threonine-protein kinase DCLK1 [Tetrabaena socialis]|eukprot:PNH07661.1 Serine/threonine-protein kinase DCLK1 [Tetrabaena socialis]